MDIQSRVLAYKEDIIEDIKRLVNIKSVEEAPQVGMPFGEGPAKALAEALKLGEEKGFTTKNVDNYAGYIEMGSGEDLIGILAHVDVVPEGDGWTYEPYNCTLADGYLYGRGVADDKGPAIMGLYAMKIIKEMQIPLNKRIRLVLGSNEETGFGCVKHYKEVEGGFTMGFTPDAGFPVTFGEKGNYSADFSAKLDNDCEVKILNLSGGEARNVVAPSCSCVIDAEAEKLEEIKVAFEKFYKENDTTGVILVENGQTTLVLDGKPAHASLPELGMNAISYMIEFLSRYTTCSFVTGYNELIKTDFNGKYCGAYSQDQYGITTMNIGMISTVDGVATATIDIRFPVTSEYDSNKEDIKNNFEAKGFGFRIHKSTNPLFVDPNSDLIKALYDTYVEVTGDTENKPMTMGGGTYAKAFDNMVAFGPEFVGENNRIHMADEYISVESVLKATEIYVKALIKMLEI